MKPQSVLFWKR